MNLLIGLAVLICISLLPQEVCCSLVSRDRAKRQSSDQQILSPALTLVTNSTPNCDTGLTHRGVFVLVEYRLVDGQTAGEWKLLGTANIEPTGHSNQFYTIIVFVRVITTSIIMTFSSLLQIMAAMRKQSTH